MQNVSFHPRPETVKSGSSNILSCYVRLVILSPVVQNVALSLVGVL